MNTDNKIKQIIRVEHADGLGMFMKADRRKHCVYNCPELQALADRHESFPLAKNEVDVWKDSKEWFCAYLSIVQLQEWVFPKEFEHLFSRGSKVWLLDVIEWQEGKHQVVYTKKSIISKKDISELFI